MKPEEEYKEAIEKAFSLPNEPITRDCGLALIHVLQNLDFRSGNFDTRSHPCSGSLDADSEIIASHFASVSDSKVWWMSQYSVTTFDGLAGKEVQNWIEILRDNTDKVF
jgi:hypothetical protein